jgi:hypothetical protein
MDATSIQVIKVAAPKVERASANPSLADLGKKRSMSRVTYGGERGKRVLGSQGYMTVEDFERKNYLPYGLKASDIKLGATTEKAVEAEVDAMAKRIAELEAQLAKKSEPVKEKDITIEQDYLLDPEVEKALPKTRRRRGGNA